MNATTWATYPLRLSHTITRAAQGPELLGLELVGVAYVAEGRQTRLGHFLIRLNNTK